MKMLVERGTLRRLMIGGPGALNGDEWADLARDLIQGPIDDNHPEWEKIALGIRTVQAEIIDLEPGMVGFVDQGVLAMRETLDLFGVDLHDEWHAYVFLVTCQVLAHMAQFARKAEQINDDSYGVVLGMVRALMAAGADMIPPAFRL